MKLSENIRSLRTKKGLTQKELAAALAVSPQAVSRWEKGQVNPDIIMLERLATFFGTTIDALVGRGAEYIEGLRRQLADLRMSNRIDSPALALAECDLYEKLALAGVEQARYYTALVRYKQREDRYKGFATEEAELNTRLDGARVLVKEHLKGCPADKRMMELQHIFTIEEEERLEDWQEFVPTDFEYVNYSDLLLFRYRTGHDDERFEKELQYNSYRRVSALLYSLVNGRCTVPSRDRTAGGTVYGTLHPVSYYETMLDTLQVFSKREWDLFLPHRSLIYVCYAAALLRDKRTKEGFAVLERLKNLLLHAEKHYLKGEKLTGSVPLLSRTEEENTLFRFGQMMESLDRLHLPEFAPYKEDPRLAALLSMWQEITRRVSLQSLKKEDRVSFELLLQKAREIHESHKDEGARQPQAIVFECVDGSICSYYHDYHDYSTEKEEPLLSLLERDRPLVKRMVVLWKGDGLDVPSYALRERLLEIHPENGNAFMLLQGYYKYNPVALSLSMPVKKA